MIKINVNNFREIEFLSKTWKAIPAAGTAMEEILAPEYWANVLKGVSPHDTIDVVPEDGAFYAKLFVTNTGKGFVKTQVLLFVELSEKKKTATPQNIADTFDVNYAGPVAKWRVIRKSDNVVVSTDVFVNRDEAEEWLNKNSKKLMAA